MSEDNSQKRRSFTVYESFYKSIETLPKKNQLELYRAIFEYALYENQIELSDKSNGIWFGIVEQLKANKRKWQNGIKGAEHGAKGAEYGGLGGRPSNPITPQKPPSGGLGKPPKGNPPNGNSNSNSNKEYNNSNVNPALGFDFTIYTEIEKEAIIKYMEVRREKGNPVVKSEMIGFTKRIEKIKNNPNLDLVDSLEASEPYHGFIKEVPKATASKDSITRTNDKHKPTGKMKLFNRNNEDE